MGKRKKVGLLLAVLLVVVSAGPVFAVEDELARGRTYSEQFLSGAVDELWAMFAAPLQDVFGTAAGLEEFYAQVVSSYGAQAELVQDEITSAQEWFVYQGLHYFPATEAFLIIQWAFDGEGLIGGMFVSQVPQEAPSEFMDYETKTDLRLPFEGEWYVVWGGRTIIQNYHASDAAQRFALDFLVVKGGSTYTGDGSSNEQYYAFGLPILAPADGVVVVAVDGVPDNIPGVMNPEQPLGNYVVLDHQNGEYSFLAHLQQGSVTVQAGDWVRKGDPLGLCGNSGNSGEPHLHYHLQNTPGPQAGQGLPAQFASYLANGEYVERGEPVRGGTVAHAEQ